MNQRKDLVPKECSRCGSDLLYGRSIFNLPFNKTYLCLCGVCTLGLGLDKYYINNNPDEEELKSFWNKEIK